MGEIKWRRPHLRVAPPSEDMFQDDENEECGVYDAPRDLEDPVFDGLRNRSVRKVLVISYFSGHNFGDRLGVPILNSVLPSHVEIEHVPFLPCGKNYDCADISVEDAARYDAVILGIGMSVYRPVLNDNLMAILKSSPLRIGIFGTQYQESLPRDRMKELLGMLDLWLARYQTDLTRFGHLVPRNRSLHMGDWMISSCPMRDPSTYRFLSVSCEFDHVSRSYHTHTHTHTHTKTTPT